MLPFLQKLQGCNFIEDALMEVLGQVKVKDLVLNCMRFWNSVWLFGFVKATTFRALDLSAEDWAFSLLLTVMWGGV